MKGREKSNVGTRQPYVRVLGTRIDTDGVGRSSAQTLTTAEEEEFVPYSTFTPWCDQERYAFTAQADQSKHNLLMKITYKLAVTGRYQVHDLHGLEGLRPGMYPDGV